MLCDFGLVRMRAGITVRTAWRFGGGIVGSRNWMAPERLVGSLMQKPCDIYAFGMTLYEVSAGYVGLKSACLMLVLDLRQRDTVQ